MGTTPGGLPYPEPTDPIANGAVAIKNLATAIDPTLTGKLDKAGGTVTGTIVSNVAGAGQGIQLRNASQNPTLAWQSADGATRWGFVQGVGPTAGTQGLLIQADSGGGVRIRSGGGTTDRINVTPTGDILQNAAASWKAQVAGDDRIALGTNVTLDGLSAIAHLINGVEMSRFTTTDLLIGKTSSSGDVRGSRSTTSGTFMGTVDAVSTHNIWLIKAGAANASGQTMITFRGGDSATQIGSITINSTGGVNYNGTSHGPWKGEVADLDGDDALDLIAAWRPVSYRWKQTDGRRTETGTPTGPVEHGFIAQELASAAPHAVFVGYGTEAEQAAWKARYDAAAAADEPFDEPEPFAPWGVDTGQLVPDLVAAVQALARRVAQLEGAS